MDIMVLGAIGELVGGVAVLATLVYLAIQVRQSTVQLEQTHKAISASAFHGITSLVIPLQTTLASSREMGELIVKARSGLAGLDEVDRYRFGLCASMIFRVIDDIYEYHRTGLMDQSQWVNWELVIDQNLASEGMREYWDENSSTYTPKFQNLVAGVIRRLDASPSTAPGTSRS